MAHAVATAHLACTAEELHSFALDVEQYREVDDKIGPIDWVRTNGDITEFRFRPTLPGLPPAPKVVSRMRLTPGERIDIAFAPVPQNRPVNLLSSFAATFSCTPEGDGIRATRTITLDLPPGVRHLVDGYLERRLQASIDRELELTRARFSGQAEGETPH